MASLKDVFGYIQPVRLDMPPSEDGMMVLRNLQNLGFKTPFIYGGMLRDRIMGAEPKDIDISLNAMDVFETRPTMKSLEDWVLSNIGDIRIRNDLSFDEFGKKLYAHFEGIIDGRKLDLAFETPQRTLTSVLLHADAPIDSIAMDTAGNIWAHPLFEEHAEEMLFVPMRPPSTRDDFSTAQRFQKLSAKYPDLRMILPEDLPPEMIPNGKGVIWQTSVALRVKLHEKLDELVVSFM